jgi:hypothetical protein
MANTKRHFTCDGCLESHVHVFIESTVESPDLLRQREGHIYCPLRGHGCTHDTPFARTLLAQHISEECFELSLGSRDRRAEQRAFEDVQEQLAKEERELSSKGRKRSFFHPHPVCKRASSPRTTEKHRPGESASSWVLDPMLDIIRQRRAESQRRRPGSLSDGQRLRALATPPLTTSSSVVIVVLPGPCPSGSASALHVGLGRAKRVES